MIKALKTASPSPYSEDKDCPGIKDLRSSGLPVLVFMLKDWPVIKDLRT